MDRQSVAEVAKEACNHLRVLSNEKRLAIVQHLVSGESSVQELQDATGLAQSTVSQQLAILRGERIVTARREAQSVFYTLSDPQVLLLVGALTEIYGQER